MYQDSQYEVDTGIATITIDRPGVKNVLKESTLEELNDAIRRASNDEGAFAFVMTGTEGAFCAGADVSSMPDRSEQTK